MGASAGDPASPPGVAASRTFGPATVQPCCGNMAAAVASPRGAGSLSAHAVRDYILNAGVVESILGNKGLGPVAGAGPRKGAGAVVSAEAVAGVAR